MQGLPPYTYNYLMTGLQTYCCCTCLCRFGCMTAIHGCPHCGHAFDYHPDLFHTKLQCSRPSCGKAFGFFLFPVSDRVEKEMREGESKANTIERMIVTAVGRLAASRKWAKAHAKPKKAKAPKAEPTITEQPTLL